MSSAFVFPEDLHAIAQSGKGRHGRTWEWEFVKPPKSAGRRPFLPLLLTVFNSILEVFVLCVAGYFLAKQGILDKKTQRQLNRLNVSIFTPSLLFSKVAFFLTPAKLKELWIIPIFFIIVTSVSMIVSFLLGWLFRLKRSQRNFAMAAAMFMNSNSLPIALMQSLAATIPALRWDEDDNMNVMVGRALTYLVCYSTLGMVLRWSYGVKLLAQADDGASALTDLESPAPSVRPEPEEAFATLGQNYASRPAHIAAVSITNETEAVTAPDASTGPFLRPPNPRRLSKFYNSFPNSPTESVVRLVTPVETPSGEDPVQNSEDDEDAVTVRRAGPVTPTSSRFESLVRRTEFRARKALKSLNNFMTVPLWAALASIIVACIQPLQHALDSHMAPIKGALRSAGNCSIPITLVVLGAYFYVPPDPAKELVDDGPESRGGGLSSDARFSGSGTTLSARSSMGSVRDLLKLRQWTTKTTRAADKSSRRGETRTVVIAIASRMLITPLLLLPLFAILARYELHDVLNDPVFIVSNVLLISSPPAVTLAQITQVASGDAFERLISRTIFWAYCVVTPPATIVYVVLGLVLARI